MEANSSVNSDKKRTRPVSACDNCRSRKVKCNLRPDVPICEGCSISGKKCIFRIDDLSPTLRLERFGEYGPPGENARQIASRSRKMKGKASGEGISPKGTAESKATSAGKQAKRVKSAGDTVMPNTSSQYHQGHPNTPLSASMSQMVSLSPVASQNRRQDVTYSTILPPLDRASSSSVGAFEDVVASPTYHRMLTTSNMRSAVLPSFRSAFPSRQDPMREDILAMSPHSAHQGNPTRLTGPVLGNADHHASLDRRNSLANDMNGFHLIAGTSDALSKESPLIQTQPQTQSHPIDRVSTRRLGASSSLLEETEASNDLAVFHSGRGASGSRVDDGHIAQSRSQVSPEGDKRGQALISSQKIALPFFRWFGATANTPGIRRIKIGVYHEAEGADERENARTSRASPSVQSDYGATVSDLTPSHAIATPSPSASHSKEGDTVISSSTRNLFDPDRPRYPRRDILLHLVKLFFKLFHSQCFPWMDESEIVSGAESGQLPAILANSICALAARFSHREDLQRCNTGHEPFADMAKILIVPMLSWPSIDVIEALVIISYAEFAAGADSGLWTYVGLALRMSADLGLQHEVTICSMRSEKEQDRARLLFWAIISLDRITCFGTGRPLTMRDDSIDCELPTLRQDATSTDFVFGHIVRVLLKRGRIGELLNRKTDETSLEDRGHQLKSMWNDLVEYYENLPASLRFGVNAFRKLATAGQGAAFVYLHVLLQSTLSLLNRPSLLRKFDREFAISAPTKLASIANHASGTIVSILRFAQDAAQERRGQDATCTEDDSHLNMYIDGNPYLDQLILPAGRAFLSEREAAKDALSRLGYDSKSRPISRGGEDGDGEQMASIDAVGGPFHSLIASRHYAQANLATSQAILDRLTIWWKGANWPARALRQEAAGSDVLPDGTDEEAQPVSVRDVEMVLKWARARSKAKNGTKTPNTSAQRSSQDEMRNEGDDADIFAELSRLLSSHTQAHDPAIDSSSPPMGLGFSGSYGTAMDVDMQALIDAWANEQNFAGSILQQEQQQSSTQDAHDAAQASNHAPHQQSASTPFLHDNGALIESQAAPSFSNELDAMQLEELFYKSGLGIDTNGSFAPTQSIITPGNASEGILDAPMNHFDEALFSMLSPFVQAAPAQK